MCEDAEKAILEPIAPFLPYWELVQGAKKQMKILASQRKHLLKQLRDKEFSTGGVDTENEGD